MTILSNGRFEQAAPVAPLNSTVAAESTVPTHAATAARVGTVPAMEMPHATNRIGVIRGWKVAPQVAVVDGRVEFTPIASSARYGLDAEAACWSAIHTVFGEPHDLEVPSWDCECGFWACSSIRDLSAALGSDVPDVVGALLSVELHGRVIEHDRGWRASHQRVTEVWLPGRCTVCASKRAVRAVRYPASGAVTSLCQGCAEATPTRTLRSLPGVPFGLRATRPLPH